MGKASSAKKVAKAARAGGRPGRSAPKLGFPMGVFAIIVAGTLLVAFARNDRQTAQAEAPVPGDHWHNAYAIYVCDSFLPPLGEVRDATGIHTHDDGAIHIHPFGTTGSGRRANWGTFADSVGMQVGSTSITLPDGTTYDDNSECNGEPASVVFYRWPADDPDAEPTVFTSGFSDLRFENDRDSWTVAVVTEGTEVPRPPTESVLDNLSDVIENPEAGGTDGTDGTDGMVVEDIVVDGDAGDADDATSTDEADDGEPAADGADEQDADAGTP